jgi:hypothetical protein
MNIFVRRAFSSGLIVAALATFGCASSTPQGKLADGSPVPAGQAFTPPTPTTRMPLDLLGRIGSSGVRGLFRAEVTVSKAGIVSALKVTHSLGEAVDAEIIPALRQLLFNPATLNGEPVAAIYDARFNFTSN